MDWSQRAFVKIIKEIADEENIELSLYSEGWAQKLTKNNKTAFIYGYKFPNNSASSEQVCNDKPCVSEILDSKNIKNVKHIHFTAPFILSLKEQEEDKKKLEALLSKYKKLVIKPVSGTGGKDVYKAETLEEIENAVNIITQKNRDFCVCPYEKIEDEARVIILDKEVMLVFKKERPFVLGDGEHTVKELISLSGMEFKAEEDLICDLSFIPKKNEKSEISWKHNLGRGAYPFVVKDEAEINELSKIAIPAFCALNVNFASVDIVKTSEGYKVLEINSGVMMENFAKSSEENYNKAKSIYKKAIMKMF